MIVAAVTLTAEVSDSSKFACRSRWCVGSRNVGLAAAMRLLCLTPSVVRKLMLELGEVDRCLYSKIGECRSKSGNRTGWVT